MNDVFERCLDLYMCPRLVKQKMDMAPEVRVCARVVVVVGGGMRARAAQFHDPVACGLQDLLPKLPDPAELRPYPTLLAVEVRSGGRGGGGVVHRLRLIAAAVRLRDC